MSGVTEDANVTSVAQKLFASGTISITGSTFSTTVVSAVGDLGTLVLAANGQYTYTVSNSAVQFLAAGDTKVDTFAITAPDIAFATPP